METNSRSKLFPILGIVVFCVMVGMVLYPYLSPSDETSPQISSIEPSKYSFEKPGQLKQPSAHETNPFKETASVQLEQLNEVQQIDSPSVLNTNELEIEAQETALRKQQIEVMDEKVNKLVSSSHDLFEQEKKLKQIDALADESIALLYQQIKENSQQ